MHFNMNWRENMFGMSMNLIECPEAREMVANGAQLVDVRSPQEFGMGQFQVH